MVILQLDMTHFGKLENRKLDLRTGMNVITGGNESGKTTIAAFIKAMLFGLTEDDADYALFYPRTYRGVFGGRMKVLQNGAFYEITREFSKDNASLQVVKSSDGSVVENPEEWISRAMAGISREEYEGSAFISQKAVANDQLTWGIPREKTAEEKAKEAAAEEHRAALARILEQKAAFEAENNPDVTDQYDVLNKTIDGLQQDLAAATENRDKKQEVIGHAKSALEESVTTTNELNEEKEKELKARMLEDKRALEEFAALKKTALEKRNVFGVLLMTLGLVGALATYFYMASRLVLSPENPLFIYVMAGFGGSAFLFLLGLIVTIVFAVKQKKTAKSLDEQAAARAQANEAEQEYQYYMEHKEELEAKVEDRAARERAIQVMEEELAVLEERVQAIAKDKLRLENDREVLAPAALRQEEVTHELRSLEAAAQSFQELIAAFEAENVDVMAEKASQYAARLNTAGILKIDEVRDVVSVTVDKTKVPLTALSSSTMLETDLAVRLARLDAMDPQKSVTLVLDDMFISLDNSHLSTAVGVLRSLGRQVVLFSSQNRERTAL